MNKDLVKRIYFYVVCFVCLGCGMIFLGAGIYGTLKIANPEFTLRKWEYQRIATLQSFKTDWEKEKDRPQLTEDEVRVRWEDKRKVVLEAERREGLHSLVAMLVCFVIVIPVFIIHWRWTKRTEEF